MSTEWGQGRRLLILGASRLQLPAIARARDMGFSVAVADRDPLAPGVALADHFFAVSTTDEAGVVEVARQFHPNGIMTMATDMPMRAVARACHALGLPGPSEDAAYLTTDKIAMVQAFNQAGIAHPRFCVVTDDDLGTGLAQCGGAVIVKPRDSSGSRGVSLARTEAEVESALRHARTHSRDTTVLVEEYVEGHEVSVEVLCFGGSPHVVAITDKVTTGAPHFVETGHSQPTILPPHQAETICDLACRAVEALGLDNCAAHAEIMMTAAGPTMIEIGARLGGDFITSHLVPLSTGVDMVEAVIRMACGDPVEVVHTQHRGAAIRFLTETPSGGISSDGLDRVRAWPNVILADVIENGHRGPVSSSTDRVGHVIAVGDDGPTALKICAEALTELGVAVTSAEEE